MSITKRGNLMYRMIVLSILLCISVHLAHSEERAFKVRSNAVHEVKIFTHGLASLEERLRLIESAKESIDVEYFIIKADLSSRMFIQALLKKQQEGIRIRFLVDHTFSVPQFSLSIARELVEKGIEVKFFNPISKWKLLDVQFRNHRKSLIIDSHTMMTGGRNIGDEYFDLNPRFKFLDRDIVIKGEIVKEIQKTFDETYYSKLAINVLDLKLSPKKEKKILKEKNRFLKSVENDQYLEIRKFASKEYERTLIQGLCNQVFLFQNFQIWAVKISSLTDK